MPALESFDTDHMPPHLAEVGNEFRDLMSYITNNVPDNAHVETALTHLLVARDQCYQAVIQGRKEAKETKGDQLPLDLGSEDPGALRFPSFPHIKPEDQNGRVWPSVDSGVE